MTKSRSRSRQKIASASPIASIELIPIPGIPEIRKNSNLSLEITRAAKSAKIIFLDDDILVVAQKIISKSEGRTVNLSTIRPTPRARELAAKLKKDPRLIELILQQSTRIVRSDHVLIVETHHGLVCANAGVDHSNVPGKNLVTVLPKNPDKSARTLAAALRRRTKKQIAVIVSDTFGRPWRLGLTNVAIGAAGVPALLDLRGTRDHTNKRLQATILAVADELAAAAGLLMSKSAQLPAILIRNYRHTHIIDPAARIQRPANEDLFR
ncbi:MAG TPA: coenzyme F420-0:L-glutamate ligase [Candidatus Acidoferrum sp.]|jgi:coenzyme F420-0:L-glutamate ligase/coenzyme F420-1:gamma-L-glutamate ligase